MWSPGALSRWPVLWIILVGLACFSSLPCCDAGKKTRKRAKAKRRGKEGSSGLRCYVCQAVAAEGQQVWAAAKSSKPGSPYRYIGVDKAKPPASAEEVVMSTVRRKICNRGYLNSLPNPRGYALHLPTLEYECEDFLEEHGESLVDALTLGEALLPFCWDSDICGDDDEAHFDMTPEDADDPDTDVRKKEL